MVSFATATWDDMPTMTTDLHAVNTVRLNASQRRPVGVGMHKSAEGEAYSCLNGHQDRTSYHEKLIIDLKAKCEHMIVIF